MRTRMSAGGRREQILDGAMRIFAEKGFRGTTTRQIAQNLDISEALMFKYFPSKEALYRAIIEKRTNGSQEILFPREAIEANDDRQVFRSIASYLIRKNREDPNFMRLILYSALEGHDLSRLFFENSAMKNARILADYIRKRIREKAFRKVSPLLVARSFIGMIIHYVELQEIYGLKDDLSPEKAVDTFVDAFLYGLKENPENDGAEKRARNQ